MRILQVRFKNLNSLVGEWEIDLTHPSFLADGIFAITGPTGAGKTTLLDAICLALYGRTPRLSRVTKSENEIMSRQTGECFAEVPFETHQGRYRFHWSQRRARAKPGGDLQSPRHEMINPDSGTIIESKIKEVAEQVESVTGMDFDRFTRSMLLAQGGFSAFLQASPDDRAPILEQITGTEIYSQISIRVHERYREEREKLNRLEAETAGIILLEPEQEKELKQSLEKKQNQEAELRIHMSNAEKGIAWLSAIGDLKKEIADLDEQEIALQSEINEFEPDRERLVRASRAASLDREYATLVVTRNNQADDQLTLKEEENLLPGLEDSSKEQGESLKLAELKTVEAKKILESSRPALQRLRLLDQKLIHQKMNVTETERFCEQDAEKIDADKKARLQKQEKFIATQETLKSIDGYLKEHEQDEWLVANLVAVEEQLKGLLSSRKEILQKENDEKKSVHVLEQASQSLESLQKQSAIQRQVLEKVSKQVQQDNEVLNELLGGRLLREYRADQENLLREMGFFRKIAELEDYRAKLEDGKTCPLCGATEHPFAKGNTPVPDEIEQKIEALGKQIEQAEKQEVIIKKSEAAKDLARQNLEDAERRTMLAVHEKKTAEQALAEIRETLRKLRVDFAERVQGVSLKLLPLGISEIFETNIASLLDILRARLREWQLHIRKKLDIEKQLADLDSEVAGLSAVIQSQKSALVKRREHLEVLKKELDAGNNERKLEYGDKNADDEEQRLSQGLFGAESEERQAREKNEILQQNWNVAKARVASLKQRIEQRALDLKEKETSFIAKLSTVEFLNEQQFVEASLPFEQREQLRAKFEELRERQSNLKARQEDRKRRLATEIERKLTEISLEDLQFQLQTCEVSLKELIETVADFKHKLSVNAVAKERIEEKRGVIEVQKKESLRWGNLHQLIGSADGKKYRNFAQGLTFEIMIGHANRQLQKMTDRYLLLRDPIQSLELNVVDAYQAGTIRSTKNLSGGESFIVSLSLALGLSNMSSKKVRVDSLFLDEGFGTLDEESLNIALETLAGLRQDGKLIGVISHVQALKERISTQIKVVPQAGGRSQILGPGCRRNEFV